MNQALITHLFRSFEQLAHREGGLEYWLARELPELLGYTQWRNFEQVIAKAKEACRNAGQEVDDLGRGKGEEIRRRRGVVPLASARHDQLAERQRLDAAGNDPRRVSGQREA